MIALIQRVKWAKVEVESQTVGEIAHGLLVLLGVEQGDTQEKSDRLLEKVLNYRIFSDEQGKMNFNVQQAGGSLLVVSQFTLAADELKVSQSTVSSRIAQLEQMVGAPLFVRNAKSDVTPTQAGRMLYQTAIGIDGLWRGTPEGNT